MVVNTQQVLMATAPMEECVKRAQVVIVSEKAWHLIAPKPYRMHCLNSFAPVPGVACPVVDVRGVQDDEAMCRIMQGCVADHAGVINLDGLVTGLAAIGAKVSRQWTVDSEQPVVRVKGRRLKVESRRSKVRRVRRGKVGVQ